MTRAVRSLFTIAAITTILNLGGGRADGCLGRRLSRGGRAARSEVPTAASVTCLTAIGPDVISSSSRVSACLFSPTNLVGQRRCL